MRIAFAYLLILAFASGLNSVQPDETNPKSSHLKREAERPSSGGKAAYRHYYLGVYYYQEDQAQKALGHFRKAHQAIPEQLSFALAYSLALGATGKPNTGIELLQSRRLQINANDADYEEMQHLRTYTICLLQTQAGQFWKARARLHAIIQTEEAKEDFNPERLAGMYNLAGYLRIVDQGMPTSHLGRPLHNHLQVTDLETALPYFDKALSIDSSRTDTKFNAQLIRDTLQREPPPYVMDPRTLELQTPRFDAPVGLNHLPYGAASLDAFGQYDEVLFLVDISGSMVMEEVSCMATDRFNIMRDAAAYLIDRLPENCTAGLATIGGDCETEPTWWIAVDSMERAALRFEVRYLNPDGTTPLLNTLVKTPRLFSDTPGKSRAVFFISDGENVCSLPGVDICDWANSLRDQNIELNVLTFLDQGLQNSGAFAEYACLTDRSGGEIRYFNPGSCMIDHFRFDLLDRVQFELPPIEKVNCWGGAFEKMWAIFVE
ncbi:MAG: vWA domain-containing protein [Bacteroidota bacterium]